MGIPGVGGHTKGLGIAEGWVLTLFTLLQYRYLVMATKAGETQPTGMLSCLVCAFRLSDRKKDNCDGGFYFEM